MATSGATDSERATMTRAIAKRRPSVRLDAAADDREVAIATCRAHGIEPVLFRTRPEELPLAAQDESVLIAFASELARTGVAPGAGAAPPEASVRTDARDERKITWRDQWRSSLPSTDAKYSGRQSTRR